MRVANVMIAGAVCLALVLGSGCNRNKLTSQNATSAIFRWGNDSKVWVPCGGFAHNRGGVHLRVLLVQELPQENAAKATLDFQDVAFREGCPDQHIFSGPGEAVFIYSTEGKWVLTRVSTSEGFNSIVFDKLSVPVN